MLTIIREELRSHYKFQRDCLNIRALTNSSFSYKNEKSGINFFSFEHGIKIRSGNFPQHIFSSLKNLNMHRGIEIQSEIFYD